MLEKWTTGLKSIVGDRNKWITFIFLLFLIGTPVKMCNDFKNEIAKKDNLIEQLNNKSEEIEGGRKATVIEQDVDDILNVKTDDPRIKELQAVIAKYKKELKNKGSVTISDNTIKYDTIYKAKSDTTGNYANYVDTISNGYIFTTFGRKNDSVLYNLSIRNKQTTVISEEKKSLFGPRILTVKTTNSNPYFRTDDVVSFQTIKVKPSKFGLGIHAGYGINGKLETNPVISIGINYNLINF